MRWRITVVGHRPHMRLHDVEEPALDHLDKHLNPSGFDLDDARPAHGVRVDASDEAKTIRQGAARSVRRSQEHSQHPFLRHAAR